MAQPQRKNFSPFQFEGVTSHLALVSGHGTVSLVTRASPDFVRLSAAIEDSPSRASQEEVAVLGQPAIQPQTAGARHGEANAIRTPVSRVPRLTITPYRFESLQSWEGEVVSISASEFVATLWDLTERNNPREEAVFEIDAVSEADRTFLKEGAVFYWIIGYRNTASGQRTTESFLRFRRLPAWSKRDLDRASKRAAELEAIFQIDE